MANNRNVKVKRVRRKQNFMKNLAIGTDDMVGKVLFWHKQVAADMEKEFGDEIWAKMSNAIYIKTGEDDGEGTMSWIGSPSNTIDMIGHLIRQLAKSGVKDGGMTPTESASSLMAEITRIAALQNLEKFVSEEPVNGVEVVDDVPRKLIVPPSV